MAYKFSLGDSVFGAGDASWTGILSASGISTIHGVTTDRLVAATADINGGSVDGTTVGASTQSTVAATTLSASGDTTLAAGLYVSGAAGARISSGPLYVGVGCTVGGAVGVLSGSGASTLYKLVTTEVDSTTYRGSGALLQGITASAATSFNTEVYKRGDLETVLSGGMNYFTASTNPLNVTLPSASYGDIIYVKAGSGVTQTNFIRITMSIAKSGELGNIDGAVEQLIESPYGAVSLCYVEDSTWRIF